jgi:hypothetical protein
MHRALVDEENAYAALAEGLVEGNARERNNVLARVPARLSAFLAVASVSLLSTAFVLWMHMPSAPMEPRDTLFVIPLGQTIQVPFTGNVTEMIAPLNAPPMNSYVVPKPCLPLMVVAGVAGGVIAGAVATVLLAILGFTGIGPAAGSAAAGWQAAAGSVAAGSLFSTLQSAAMGGYGIWVLITTGVATGPAVAAAAYAFCQHVCGNCGA